MRTNERYDLSLKQCAQDGLAASLIAAECSGGFFIDDRKVAWPE
jgi:hypothetical protein